MVARTPLSATLYVHWLVLFGIWRSIVVFKKLTTCKIQTFTRFCVISITEISLKVHCQIGEKFGDYFRHIPCFCKSSSIDPNPTGQIFVDLYWEILLQIFVGAFPIVWNRKKDTLLKDLLSLIGLYRQLATWVQEMAPPCWTKESRDMLFT